MCSGYWASVLWQSQCKTTRSWSDGRPCYWQCRSRLSCWQGWWKLLSWALSRSRKESCVLRESYTHCNYWQVACSTGGCNIARETYFTILWKLAAYLATTLHVFFKCFTSSKTRGCCCANPICLEVPVLFLSLRSLLEHSQPHCFVCLSYAWTSVVESDRWVMMCCSLIRPLPNLVSSLDFIRTHFICWIIVCSVLSSHVMAAS